MQWAFPVKNNYKITQYFGQNLLNYSQFGLKSHDGWDIAAEQGAPILAPADGIVVNTYNQAQPNKGGYGNEVRLLITTINKDLFYDVIFAHFLTVFVEPKQEVKAEEVLGLMNSTGFSTGSHAHVAVRYAKKGNSGKGVIKEYLGEDYTILNHDNGYFGYFDPAPFFESAPRELLNVDMRYNQVQSSLREWAWKMRHETFAKRQALKSSIPYDQRFINGAIYGHWNIEVLVNPAMYTIWTTMTKPAYNKLIKK